jgi:hypothetical protein
MHVKHILTAASIALLPLGASAASLIVPAAGTGPGANGSQWQSELTLHNLAANQVDAAIIFHDAAGASAPVNFFIPARGTMTIADVVKTKFGKEAATGAIEVVVPDDMASRVTVASRTINVSPNGEFGQDIPAIAVSDAAQPGDVAVLAGPSSVANNRFNFGLYAAKDSDVTWELLRADGTVAATKQLSYTALTQLQYNGGVQSLFGVEPQNDDAIHATVTKGAAIFYGSAINNASGDPSFVPGVKAREEIRVNFIGVDVNEDQSIEIKDANHDGVLDQPIDIFTTTGFPNYFRIVAAGEHGEPATFELLDAGNDAILLDANGTVSMAPSHAVRGETGALHVRITAGGSSVVVTIPINYR